MGDIFLREAAANPEPFTGERLTSALSGQTQIEHYHRYLYARALCQDLDVLDVASGEGYGSAQLAQVARSVVGIEYSPDTVRSASSNFSRRNLTFLQGDARALPLRDACVDAVVSFETIEHFGRQDVYLKEIRRVLRPNGRFIVSTPDRDIYSPQGMPANPYHVRELSRQEFLGLLHDRFGYVRVLLQRPIMGSALLGEVIPHLPPLVFDRRGVTHFESCDGMPRAPYIVAIASDTPLPELPHSLFIERSDVDTQSHQLALCEADLAQVRSKLDAQLQELRQAHTWLSEARLALTEAAARNHALTQSLERTGGSLRTFLRAYLPRVRRHILGSGD